MSPRDEKMLMVAVAALLIIYSFNTQLATLGGYIGFPRLNFGTVAIASDVVPPHYILRFIAINGEPLETPIDFDQADQWIEEAQSKAAHELINELGFASFADETEQIARLKAELEQIYFEEIHSAEYLIILYNTAPVGRNTFRPSFSEQVFGRYQFLRPQTQ